MSDDRGRFLWYELLTTDTDAAQAFYTETVGWRTQVWGEGEQPYTMWMAGEKSIGGLMDLPEEARKMGAPPHWLAYIGTPDVDATIAKAKELGAKVLGGPLDIPKVGRIVAMQDPQGAVFAAYTPEGEMPVSDDTPSALQFSWNELATTDHAAAFAFYGALFGWVETDTMDMGEMGPYQMYSRPGGIPLGGIFNKPAEMPGPSAWLYYVKVEDLDATLDRIKSQGGQVLNGPMEVPGGDRIAQCMDPQGAAFALHSAAASVS